jgi:E3 ubiquitin-protein ligase MYCBP2
LPGHPAIADLTEKWAPLAAEIEDLLRVSTAAEGLEHEEAHVCNPECIEYFGKPMEYARDVFVFFMCGTCGHPFFGGRAECGEDIREEAPVCARCARTAGNVKICPKHGEPAMSFKCFWCCGPALFWCHGTTHYCDKCHSRPGQAQSGPWPVCDGKCFFHPHPPNGTAQVFGVCTMC